MIVNRYEPKHVKTCLWVDDDNDDDNYDDDDKDDDDNDDDKDRHRIQKPR